MNALIKKILIFVTPFICGGLWIAFPYIFNLEVFGVLDIIFGVVMMALGFGIVAYLSKQLID